MLLGLKKWPLRRASLKKLGFLTVKLSTYTVDDIIINAT